MAIPTWTPGEVLASADVNSWFVPLNVYRTTASAIVTSTTLTSDPVMLLPVVANAVYNFFARINYTGSALGQARFHWIGPAGAALSWMMFGRDTSNNLNINAGGNDTISATNNAGVNSLNQACSCIMWGLLTVGGTAGNFQLQYAEFATDATNGTSIQPGAMMNLWRVG